MKSRRPYAALVTLLVTAVACEVPRFEGPQIQDPPPGFRLQAESHPGGSLFPEHEMGFRTAWVHTDVGGVSLIYIDEYLGVVDPDDIIAAQERMRATAGADVIFGGIEAIRIDDRNAWGWYHRVESEHRGLVDVSYTALVPYDSVSYAIRFTSGEPNWKRHAPDTLRAVVSTFGIGRTTYNMPLIAIVFGGLLVVVAMIRARRKDNADRLRSMNLVSIEEDGPELGGAPGPGSDGAAEGPEAGGRQG